MTVVVGVDGSATGAHVIEAAVAEARQRGTSLVVVHAWTFPYPIPNPEPYEPYAEAGREAKAVLDEAVDQARAGGVDVVGELVEEGAGHALVTASEGADLLVVGARGHGLASEFGSVSRHVRHHAKCPVLVVEPPGH